MQTDRIIACCEDCIYVLDFTLTVSYKVLCQAGQVYSTLDNYISIDTTVFELPSMQVVCDTVNPLLPILSMHIVEDKMVLGHNRVISVFERGEVSQVPIRLARSNALVCISETWCIVAGNITCKGQNDTKC